MKKFLPSKSVADHILEKVPLRADSMKREKKGELLPTEKRLLGPSDLCRSLCAPQLCFDLSYIWESTLVLVSASMAVIKLHYLK